VFQTPFQAVPLDFGTKDFYLQRQLLIELRLSEISKLASEQLSNQISDKYEANKDKHNMLVNWSSVKLS